jgi:dTDP-L-rhamnose 4-epimerase
LGDIRHNYADITKIKYLLGFDVKVNFENGIRTFAQWVNEQKIQKDKYNDSIEEMKKRGLYK